VAVDAAGDVFIADYNDNQVFEVTPTGVQTTVPATGLHYPYDVAMDAAGDIFIADPNNGRVVEMNRSQPPSLSFATTNVGSTSADSPQSLTIQNIGNQPLDAVTNGLVVTGPNFIQVAGTGTPADCTSGFALIPGATCNLSLSFTPQASGPLTSTAVFTDNALNASPATQSIALSGAGTQASQTITFTTIPPQYGGTVLNLAAYASASSGLPVSFTSLNPDSCPMQGASAVSILAFGTCTIQASQPGNVAYSPAQPVSQSFTTHHGSQTIAFDPIPAQYAATTITLTATASSGLTVAFASTTPTICTVSGDSAALIAEGTCRITASQAGNAEYFGASVSQSFTVHHVDQTIAFNPIPAQNAGASITLTATASSGLTVAFASATPTICTVAGDSAALIAAGTCQIQASQPGNTEYFAASVSQSFTVHHVDQTIAFNPIPAQSVGASLSLEATATSGLTVAFASTTPTVCTVANNTATFNVPGTCQIQATQPGNAVYFAAPAIAQNVQVSTN